VGGLIFTLEDTMSGITPGRRAQHEKAARQLADAGIKFEVRNDGAHLLIEHQGIRVEFWPGSGAWRTASGYSAAGTRELVQFLTDRPDDSSDGWWWYAGDDMRRGGLFFVTHRRAVFLDQRLTNPTSGIAHMLGDMKGRWARAVNPLTGTPL
jgi:hypothetical protein